MITRPTFLQLPPPPPPPVPVQVPPPMPMPMAPQPIYPVAYPPHQYYHVPSQAAAQYQHQAYGNFAVPLCPVNGQHQHPQAASHNQPQNHRWTNSRGHQRPQPAASGRPSLARRLFSMFNAPVGRASTIASSDDESISNSSSTRAQGYERSRVSLTSISTPPSPVAREAKIKSHTSQAEQNVASPAMATVRSDDFVAPTERIDGPSRQKERNSATAVQGDLVEGVEIKETTTTRKGKEKATLDTMKDGLAVGHHSQDCLDEEIRHSPRNIKPIRSALKKTSKPALAVKEDSPRKQTQAGETAKTSEPFNVSRPVTSSMAVERSPRNTPKQNQHDKKAKRKVQAESPQEARKRQREPLEVTLRTVETAGQPDFLFSQPSFSYLSKILNMMMEIDLDDSSDSADDDWENIDQRFDIPQTPSTTSDEAPQNRAHIQDDSEVESSDNEPVARDIGDLVPRPKPGGYESRVEQILYENPSMPILITDAGKSAESGGRYIVYTIRTGNLEVRRRYSEFASLREALTRLHPTLIIPPIPEKHTMADYAANPTNAKQDQQIIDLRKRMLAVFLNRCRRMDEVRTDGVWWRFLDPNASWSEVLHSHPVASVPKSVLKAPPLDPANPTPAHAFLPVPASSAKLRTTGGPGVDPNAVAGTGSHVFGRFPPDSHTLSEQELDPYFITYEASIKELEQLLSGSMEKVNRRTLSHLSVLAADLCELGSKFNAFALSEQAPSLGPALERVGQAADSSYIATEELSGSLGASFAEPMRENAQFAGVVRSVLKYRVLKRVQQEQTSDELNKKIALLDQLERSEQEAKRIEQYLSSSQQITPPPKRSTSLRETGNSHHQREGSAEDTASIDSDFPPTHGEPAPSASQGVPQRSNSTPGHKKAASSNSITNKIFGPIRHAIQGVADVDPERTRRDMIGKTRESIEQLEQAKVVSEHDVKEASASILKDLKRFQDEKEEDLRRYMLAYAKSQIEWAKKNKETWEDAKAEVGKIDES
ncbi:hypothetical protein CkaCkLH20_06889 [Colletotrichum karsti]|uniref:PX domain-containing protein n=1 Tax=Colletotrichum karsti TaxID=1095194 RepID=A0A9P6I300_9PEZI|nr:uncharacterized protein CkaCkLH20_06889 [Colletotrichum karsti]KAF9875508.1 hypothetical protein CkaCkLH20_06889 [Colletotrichum karsti]